jgi:biopolymer transport protein ExbD
MNVSDGGGGGQDFDLNLAPIIDCFTVLITYLLVTASFIALNAIEVGVSANGEAPAEASAPTDTPLNMEILLAADRNVSIKLIGGPENLDLSIPLAPAGTSWDLAGLSARVADIKQRYPALQDASVTAEPTVKYKDMVTIIESLKKVFPKIFLAG